jgi:hypothetical protein
MQKVPRLLGIAATFGVVGQLEQHLGIVAVLELSAA